MIVLAVPDFEPLVGGTTTQVRLLAEALGRRRLEAVVVTRRRRREWPRSERVAGLRVVRLGPPGRGVVGDKAAIAPLAVWLARRRADIDVLHSVMWLDAVTAAAAAGLLGRTLLTWGASGDAADAMRGRRSGARGSLLRRARQVALTGSMAREVEAAGLGNADVVPIAVDRERFRPPSEAERAEARAELGLPAGSFAVVYVGHLRRLKRVDLLVEAFARLVAERADARLVLAGGSRGASDDVEGELREQVARLGLASSVSFRGVGDPQPAYFAADAVVLASEREGMPNTLAEAMACGVACVAPVSAGGEALLDVVVTSNAPEDLLAELRRLAESPEERTRRGAAGVARAAAFDPEAVADRYVAIYRELGL